MGRVAGCEVGDDGDWKSTKAMELDMYYTLGIEVRDKAEGPSDGFLYQRFSTGRSVNGLLEAKAKFYYTRSRRAKHDRAE